MRRPALLPCKQHPGGVRQNRPSATTSGTCECTRRDRRAPLMCTAPRSCPGGSGAKKSPRWSAERRASPMRRKAPAGACGPTSLARRRVPLHPSACRRSAPLIRDEGPLANLGGDMPREQDDARALSIRHPEARGRRPSLEGRRPVSRRQLGPCILRGPRYARAPQDDGSRGRLPPRLHPPYPRLRPRRRGATGAR